MVSSYYRRFVLQAFVVIAKAWVLSVLLVTATYGTFWIFRPILKRGVESTSTPLRTAIEFLVFTSTACTALSVLAYRWGRRRKDDPFRYVPFTEQYFTLTDEQARALIERLRRHEFKLESSSLESRFLKATKVREFEAPEPPHSGLTRLTRRVSVEAQAVNGKWEGRIHVGPTNWIVFHDGADLSRVALKSVAQSLELSLRSNPDAH